MVGPEVTSVSFLYFPALFQSFERHLYLYKPTLIFVIAFKNKQYVHITELFPFPEE